MANVVLNIMIGLGTGIVAGIVVVRATRFGHLKQELHRMIRNWGVMGNEVIEPLDCRRMRDIAAELAFLGHRLACESVLSASAEVERRQDPGQLKSPEPTWPTNLLDLDRVLQKRFRELRPDWIAILVNGSL
ncbi:hypothetical protein CEK29_07130 [Bordetella genomosp. 5]|uniref:hypothetical protein n=1 Tax=Bordetella genomosp. 5 TaxID=1395608 RepID=UPI000B9EC40E|nr:hypothetical protein [Bordetella genomosp. 5]OZI44496.1 hypothetical protein CEK29_07130 [Bordetella genomosp. 5]